MSSFTCNSILLKSSLKNMSIFLNSFKIGTFCYIVYKLVANIHFLPKNLICRHKSHLLCHMTKALGGSVRWFRRQISLPIV